MNRLRISNEDQRAAAMIHVIREQLPESYLLILEDGPTGPEVPLERGLYRAARSRKKDIWIDCSLLSELPDEAAELLLAYQHHLPSVGKKLVLSHVCDPVQLQLRAAAKRADMPPVVLSWVDALHRPSYDED